DVARKQDLADQLIRAFRIRGHLMADVNPLGSPPGEFPELTPEYYGLTAEDMDGTFSTIGIGGPCKQTLREILARLRSTYCRSIGAQFMHLDDLIVRDWLATRMEECENRLALSRDAQVGILEHLTDASIFEQ